MPTPTVNFNLPTNSKSAEPRTLLRNADGDTPYIEQPLRMVSVDTPEKAHYAGSPPVSQPKLDTCRQRLQGTFYNAIPQTLRTYLIGKLGASAAADHIAAGYDASAAFEQTVANRLTNPDGTMRKLGVIPTGEIVDRYGRMLAYIVPWYANTASDPLPPPGDPRRATFNLNMIENGWGAFFPVYKSLPKDADMNNSGRSGKGPDRRARNPMGKRHSGSTGVSDRTGVGIAEDVVLGATIAHEIGHQLLHPPKHSSPGIMWSTFDDPIS